MKDPATTDRHHRQRLLPVIGDDGQQALSESTVLVAGCGALGTVAADLLCRAGVGTLVLVDRDVVELTNLQRQTLYTQRDAERGTPKATPKETQRRSRDPNMTGRALKTT